MKVHLVLLGESKNFQLLLDRAQHTAEGHTLIDDPAAADLILITGDLEDSAALLHHPLYLTLPEKCAVYNETDNFLPLLPGVYCSAIVDDSSRAGRTFNYAYISRNGEYHNPHIAPAPGAGKKYLFTFQGGSTSLLRKRMYNLRFDRSDILIENTSDYYHWEHTRPNRQQRQQNYVRTIHESHFVLCPHGAGAGSVRLFEVMACGVAPVLLADDYLLPPNIDWDSFLIRVPEKDIARLPEILEPLRASSAERGRRALQAYNAEFKPAVEFDRIVALCAASLRHGPPAEAVFRRRQKLLIARARLRARFSIFARAAILKTLKILHLKNPYQMNR